MFTREKFFTDQKKSVREEQKKKFDQPKWNWHRLEQKVINSQIVEKRRSLIMCGSIYCNWYC